MQTEQVSVGRYYDTRVGSRLVTVYVIMKLDQRSLTARFVVRSLRTNTTLMRYASELLHEVSLPK